ncbi:MAG TPA: GNAT family N-acetyltransferase, partial [Dongiaceae bacterium]|nr:GNAT family N-acetyltransferase [Dongiaceae bacterium]
HAQVNALGFYERAGFVAEGEEFDEAGIRHRLMRTKLEAAERAPPHPLPPPVRIEPLIADSLSGAEKCIDTLAEGAQHKLWIYSRDLDRDLLDREPFLAALKRIALSGRGAEVRVLVQDPAEAVRDRHRLLHLAARLPSFVLLRTPILDEDKQYPSAFMLNDQGGLFFRVLGSRFEGDGSTHEPGRHRQLLTYFEAVWERSQQDPELRRMTI